MAGNGPERGETVNNTAALREPRSRLRTSIHIFFVSAVLTAGGMFVFKLYSFLMTVQKDELAGFATDPIITYFFVALGFLLLLAWAFLSGQFRDLERPKYEMLERVYEQERQGL